MKNIPKLLTAAFVLLTLTGCSDHTDLGNRAVIQALAIDFDEGYRVSALMFSSGGGGGNTIDAAQENVIKVTGEGETLTDALAEISLIDGKRIYMSETKLLILGSGFEKKSASRALNTLYKDMRCSLNMPVCCVETGEKAEFLTDIRFTEGITSADKPLSMIENGERLGVTPKTTLLDLLANSAGGKVTLLPVFTESENGRGMTAEDDGKIAVLSGTRRFRKGFLLTDSQPHKAL